MKLNRAILNILLVILAFITLPLMGCGSKGGGAKGGASIEVGSITLTSTSTKLNDDGVSSAVITAEVKDVDGKNIANGTEVTFTSENMDIDSTPGSGTELTYKTTVNAGKATATLTASKVMICPKSPEIITVKAGDVTKTINITILGPANSITLTSGSSTIEADGSSTVLINALVKDCNGNFVGDGTTVTFKTSAGTLESYTRNGSTTTMDVDTTDGVASVLLISSTKLGAATVTATANYISKTTSVEFVAGPVAKISVSSSPANLTVGIGESTITAIVLDENDNPVADDTTLTFTVISGKINGSTTVNAQTEGGVAEVTYTAPGSVPASGNDTVTVESTNNVTGTALITLIGPQIASVTLSADPTSLPADGTSKSLIRANITLVGGAGNVPDGTTVNFSIIQGSGHGSITPTATTAGGTAIATLTSGTTAETVTIRAEAGGRKAEIQVQYTPGSVSLTIVPNSLLATGQQTCAVTAALKDTAGLPVPNGQTVSFTLNDQSLGNIPATGTTSGGQGLAKVTFTGAKKGGTVTVTASWNSGGTIVSGSETIFIQPPPGYFEISAGSPDPSSINVKGTGGKSTSLISFDVKDASGNLVADGYRVDFSIDSGPNGGEDIIPATTTTKDGKVSTILRSGTKSGPVSIKVKYFYEDISASMSGIAINAGPPVGEEFGIFANYINISGLALANLEDAINVNVADIYGNAVPDGTAVSFKTYNTGGFFEPNIATTISGLATNNLHSSGTNTAPLGGFVFVTAEANNGGRTTHVTSIASSGNYVYAGTDGGGVYKSSDAGATWTNISRSSNSGGQNVVDPYVNDIFIDPDDNNTIYAATGYLGQGHLYRSLDGGDTWNSNYSEEWDGILSVDNAVLTVVCDGGGSDYVWAGTEGLGAIYSTNGEDFQWGGSVTNPVPGGANIGDGAMSLPVLSPSTITENWTATYVQPLATATLPQAGFLNTGSGTMSGITTDVTATLTEDWTVQYDGTQWAVQGSVSGVMTNKATTGVPYISDSGEISFTISAGTVAFVALDYFTFSTTASDPYWNVAGSVSGIQFNKAETNLWYNSDDYEVSFIITEGLISFSAGDTFTFSVAESGLGYGRTVKDIVKKPGTNGNTAVLYAATGRGVYRSINGGQTWSETSNFTGDNVNVLAHHPTLNIIYAGTEDSGVWLSNNNGATWTQYVSGLGRGISASSPVAGLSNTGNGIMSKVNVFSAAQSEIWTVTCKTTAQNSGVFSVTGSVSGDQPDYNIATPGPYKVTIGGKDLISFTISDGSTDFAVGDAFTFRTTRDEGRKIKDLLVDDGNDRLYCITNFWGTLEPHAVGNVYSVGIDALSGLPTGDWSEANKGLPQFEPPDDMTLFAQHVLAPNVEGAPTALYIGGEGINFYKATAGIAAGNPDWKVSKTGMTNLIMARMPVLFSGYCNMNIPKVETNGTTIAFTVYIQDSNGNPPIEGSKFEVSQKIGDKKEIIYSLVYPDAYAYIGTWSDPSDPLTNIPIIISAQNIGQFIFEFTPACTDKAPGCSGSYQKQTY